LHLYLYPVLCTLSHGKTFTVSKNLYFCTSPVAYICTTVHIRQIHLSCCIHFTP
jgi:hypothetical protein